MKGTKKSICKNGGCLTMEFCDRFSRSQQLSSTDHSYTHATGWGICMTWIIIIMGSLYTIEKLFIQQLLASYSVTHVKDTGDRFGFKDGLNVAFAFTDYGSELSKIIEQDTKVTMKAELRGWGVPENALATQFKYVTLNTHRCSEAEMGFDLEKRDQAKFYKADPESEFDIKRMVGNWHCFDEDQPEAIELFGHYQAGNAMTLRINVMLCNQTETADCTQKADYPDYLRDKWLAFLVNE